MSKKLEELESCIRGLTKPLDEREEAEETPQKPDRESNFFKKMDDDTVERFIDGMLIVLGELEQTGKIDPIESPQDARDAILAAIRRMNQRRALVAAMTRKYARFGAKRVLRRARQEIGKALS